MDTDVVVIGAGPAGSAAATVLAAGGARVVLADRARFPRDKICGDGLLPDALSALAELGVAGTVGQAAHAVRGLRLRSARQETVWLPLTGAVIRRERLDALLLERATGAGAAVLAGATLTGFSGDGTLSGARFTTAEGEVEVRARALVLATGAARGPRELAGLAAGRRLRAAAALRGYARLPAVPDDELLIDLRRELAGGYAWAFCIGDGVWNVGCGLAGSSRRSTSLTRLAERFLRELGGGLWEIAPRGAPLLTMFPNLAFVRGNLAAVGDAAGLTRPFSGEGIGPSLWSGIIAARCLLEHCDADGVERYRRRIVERYRRDFRAWRLGEMFLHFPLLGDWLIAKAHHPGAQRRLAAVLADELPAERVLSPWGLMRLLIRR